MAIEPPPEQGQPTPANVMQHTMLQQAQAAATAQSDRTKLTRQEALLEEIDLLSPEADEDESSPPPYGDTYGEIRDEKTGLGTSARVTDDCRVNIRINQLNRRLSQIFTPALNQHVQSVQDGPPPPLPYIPPSLGDDRGVAPPPPLSVVIQVVGSRGDVQPFVALGKVLKDTYGHRVRLATHPNFKDFVHEHGLEFFSIGGDPSRLMAFMVKNPGLMPSFRSVLSGDVGDRKRDVAEYIQGCWRSCYKADDGMGARTTDDDLSEPGKPFVADCIIANPPSFAHIHCAEKLGIPLHIMFSMPYSPTQAFPHPLANIQSSNADPQLTNYMSYAMVEVLIWQGLGDIINRFRTKCLGLDPVSLIWAPGMLHRLKVPHTYCWSPALIPKANDWGPHITISGFYFLSSASNYTPAPDLQAFLDAGPPPVYIGFGSIVLDDPNAMTELIFEAVRKTSQRVLLSKGWGGMGADELHIPDGVFMLGNVPHDWLFQHVSCVVHHGGAGTTAAGISAGRTTLVVPFFGDQPFWGSMVSRAGAGPDPIPHKQLTADNLADGINFCLKPESLERAKDLASKIAAERGSDVGAQSFHQYLEVDRLRCTLVPSRAATWRIRRTQVKLSTFAACTLANAKLLDFQDLKLFRPQEYFPDEGPSDPISGFATGVFGAISSMSLGLADFPSETWKALRMPFESDRQQSQDTKSEKGNASHVVEESARPASPEQSQKSLDMHGVRSSADVSGLSASTSNIRPSSVSDKLRRQSKPANDDSSGSRVGSWNSFGSGKDHDMLSQTVPHTSKGFGRMAKTLLKSPMDLSMGITEGFHNAPKLWGDDTVRPPQKVGDLKSGARAIGKEFAFGFYDGITGLVTQPWKGAQKEGTSGFFKGMSKGIGGFVAKPGAALFGIPAYMMKGVHKEMQKLFGGSVQNYIIASRTAQGYEEWLQSSDAEKQDVIDQWNLIQKHLKKKHNREDMMQDVLEARRKKNAENRETRQNYGRNSVSSQSTSADAQMLDLDSGMPAMSGSQFPEASVRVSHIDGNIQRRLYEDAEDDADLEEGIQANGYRPKGQRQEAPDHQADHETWYQAMVASEAEAKWQASEGLEYDKKLKQAMAQSLREQKQNANDGELELATHIDDEDDENFERTRRRSEKMVKNTAAVGSGSGGVHRPSSYDPGHLAGTTRSQFEAQQLGRPAEKTTEEKTEEEIIMAYVKKQSLLEMHRRGKGKGRAIVTEDDEDDEDLQKALKLSMHPEEHDAKYRGVDASRL